MLLVKNGNIPQEMALKINIGLAVILTVVSLFVYGLIDIATHL